MQFRPNSLPQAELGSTLISNPAEIIMSGVVSPSFAGAAAKNNLTGNENEGGPGGDGGNANEERREGTAKHNPEKTHTHIHTRARLEIVTELKFKLKKKKKKNSCDVKLSNCHEAI